MRLGELCHWSDGTQVLKRFGTRHQRQMDGAGLLHVVYEIEQFSQREPEAQQDIAACQRLLLGKDNGIGNGGVDSDSPSTRIDEPDHAATRSKIFTYFRAISLGVLPSLSTSTARSGASGRMGARARRWCACRAWEMNDRSGILTRPGDNRSIPASPARVPNFRR